MSLTHITSEQIGKQSFLSVLLNKLLNCCIQVGDVQLRSMWNCHCKEEHVIANCFSNINVMIKVYMCTAYHGQSAKLLCLPGMCTTRS